MASGSIYERHGWAPKRRRESDGEFERTSRGRRPHRKRVHLSVNGQHLIPPKCMPPGGDKLQYNGTHWFCVCAENWSGETCETPPSPPPTPAPSPPPQPPSTPIPDASWRTFVKDCLDEAPVTGECTTWASGNNYGTMPNWDTSLVEDMRGYDGGYQGFGVKVHSTAIFRSGIQKK